MTFRIAAAAAAIALAFALPASAKVYPLHLYGTVSSGQDDAGYFLAGGGDLAGQAFRATFLTDDGVDAVELDDGQRSTIFGADAHNPTTATLTINGVTAIFGEGQGPTSEEHFGETSQQVGEGESYRRLSESWLYDDRDWTWTYLRLLATGAGQDFLGSRDWRSLTAAEAAASARSGSFDIWFFDSGYSTLASGKFDITSVGIPEPATWTLMVGGFGLVGGLVRRRRKVSLRKPGRAPNKASAAC